MNYNTLIVRILPGEAEPNVGDIFDLIRRELHAVARSGEISNLYRIAWPVHVIARLETRVIEVIADSHDGEIFVYKNRYLSPTFAGA